MKWYSTIWIKLLVVFLLAVLQYSNTAEHDYAWDDAIVLTENTRVQNGLKDIPELFENIKSNETQNRYGYRPISLLSFATDVQLFGMNPAASHRMNMFYYGILCALVFFFLHSFFPQFQWGNVLITILFVAHPIHTEVVANIKSRDEILAMIFGLSGLLVYRKALLEKKQILFWASGILVLLGFLSKESAITFCGIAFILPWFVVHTDDKKEYLKKCVPAIVILLVLLASRMFVYSDVFFQSNDFLLYQKGVFHQDGFVGNPLFGASFSERIATAIFLLGYFVYRLVMPLPLLHDYSYNQFPIMHWGDYRVWLSLIVLIGIVAGIVHGFRKRSELGFGLTFFLVTASIYLHLVQIAPDIFAERFIFVPSLGIGIALLSMYRLKVKPVFISIVFGLAVIPLSAATWKRNLAWKDNDTLLKTDLPNLKNCVRANYNYALLLHRHYYELPYAKQTQASAELLHYYEHTFELTDRLFNVYMDLGAAYMEFGFPDKAKVVFEKALVKYPNLSPPFVQMGKYYMSFDKYDEATPYFEKALENGAKNSDFHYLLAICEFNTSKQDKAIETMLEGEKLGVSSSAYHSLIARLYLKLDQKEKAKAALERGLILYPHDQGLKNELIRIQTAD
ncbi:MAG: tetratricopeptide repeat protein [Flavobacteriales bacterium]|nr:tetratricopeptide repeat protein [Flavobacteriales bacterium]